MTAAQSGWAFYFRGLVRSTHRYRAHLSKRVSVLLDSWNRLGWPRSPFLFSLFWHVLEGPSLVGTGIADNSIRFSPLVIYRQIFCHRLSFRGHEKQAVAVLVDLHVVAGAYPSAMFCFGFFVGIEAARA